jgi:predicted RNA-binding protein with PUA-like domain
MATFLLKTEPGEFSFDDLVSAGRSTWDGVSNNQALQVLRTVRTGDDALIYHTGDEKAVVGLAACISDPYADPSQPGLTPAGEPRFAVVDLRPVAKASTPVTLAVLKADHRFKDFALVKQPRLSVMLVPPVLDKALRRLAGL